MSGKKNYFDKYSEKARKVLEGLLDKYANEGIRAHRGYQYPHHSAFLFTRIADRDHRRVRRKRKIF